MTALQGAPAKLTFTLNITRAETGATETVEMVGVIPASLPPGADDSELPSPPAPAGADNLKGN